MLLLSKFKLLFITLFVIIITGCANREVVIKQHYIYIKPKLPYLKVYSLPNKIELKAKDIKGQICLSKANTLLFINYTKTLRITAILYKNEVIEYNKMLKDLNLTKVEVK